VDKFIFSIEWEFYITKNRQQVSFEKIIQLDIYPKITNHLAKNFKDFFSFKEEKGKGQFEITSAITSDKELLYYNFNKLKQELSLLIVSLNLEINYFPHPFLNDCGNSLQINISLWRDESNIFQKSKDKESAFLLYAVGGILKQHQKEIFFTAATNGSDYTRYNLELNRQIFKIGKYPSPTKLNWGYDNRSCLIRVVGKGGNRRLEYRGGNANCNLKNLSEKVIRSIEFGLHNKTLPIDPCYGNSFDQRYNYITLHPMKL
jgi:glutamine synthetase